MKKSGILLGLLLWGITMMAQSVHMDEIIYSADSASVLVAKHELLFSSSTGRKTVNLMAVKYPPIENVHNKIKFHNFYNLPPYSSIGYFGNGTVVEFNGKLYILTAGHCFEPLTDPTGIMFGVDNADIAIYSLDTVVPSIRVSLDDKLNPDSVCSVSFFHNLGREDRWTHRVVVGRVITLNEDSVRKDLLSDEEIQKALDQRFQQLSGDSLTGVYRINGMEFHTDASTSAGVIAYIKQRLIKEREEFIPYLKTVWTIQVTKDVYDHAEGSSGSAMRNSEGKIIGITAAASGFESVKKYYIHFVPISKVFGVSGTEK